MKLKLFVGIMVTLLLASMAFYGVPVKGFTDPPIKVGVVGPMYWIQGRGMQEGAALAAKMINDAGGINGHRVDLYFASDHPDSGTDPTTATGTAAMLELMGYGVNFVQGGFRTEAVEGERDVAVANKKIFTITGASTDWLIDTPVTTDPHYPKTVRADYATYKYMFRVTPINSTMLFRSIAGFLKYAMVAKLMPIFTKYTKPFKIAVVSEIPTWADTIHAILSNAAWWNAPMGPPYNGMGMAAYGGVAVVYKNRVDAVATTWVPGVLAAIDTSGARLIIEVISGPSGRAFANGWGDSQVKAVLAGIDVPGQEIALHWTATTPIGEVVANCQTETFLVTAGGADNAEAGNPINTVGPVKTTDFYRDYYNTIPVLFPERTSHAPIYTSYGAFDALITLKETILKWVVQVGHDWPPTSQAEYDLIIPIMEQTDRNSIVGKFKFTGPNPLPGGQTYPPEFAAINPSKKGTLHDVFSAYADLSPGYTWPTGYTRALVASWQAARLEIVSPFVGVSYSKIWAIPSWMYPYPTDVNQDGQRTITDIAIVSYAIASRPGDPRWQFVADVNSTRYTPTFRYIDGDDLTPVAYDYGQPIPLPLP